MQRLLPKETDAKESRGMGKSSQDIILDPRDLLWTLKLHRLTDSLSGLGLISAVSSTGSRKGLNTEDHSAPARWFLGMPPLMVSPEDTVHSPQD